MIINDPGVVNKNTDEDVSGATYINESVTNFNLNNIAMSQGDDHLAIIISTSFSLKILKSESVVTFDEERQLNPSMQGDPTPSLSAK
jgi:hypothetical protein